MTRTLAMWPTRAVLPVAACAATLLAACGQKGPLYLPGDPSEIRTEIPAVPDELVPEADADETGDDTDDEDS